MTLEEMIQYEKRDSYIHGFIIGLKNHGFPIETVKEIIMKQFDLPERFADTYLEEYWNLDGNTNSSIK